MVNYEQKLKNLLEDMDVGLERQKARAELTLRAYARAYEGITYDEAMLLVKQHTETLEHMDAFDPAFEYFVQERDNLLRWAQACNDFHLLGRHEHELPVHAIVSVGSTSVECNFHIPRLHYRDKERAAVIMRTIRGKVAASSEWSGGFRHTTKIDFVEL